MPQEDFKDDLHRYLRVGRESLVWKLEGLSEYDLRRPLVPTGTNLLGLVKHLASVESGYFGDTFGRPMDEPLLAALDLDADPNADLWATAEESSADLVALYRRVWDHADTTIGQLDLEAVGRVPWWPEGRDDVTLHQILIHVATETHRHAGHADIVRELIDGEVGLREGSDNLPYDDPAAWRAYRDRLETLAQRFDDELKKG